MGCWAIDGLAVAASGNSALDECCSGECIKIKNNASSAIPSKNKADKMLPAGVSLRCCIDRLPAIFIALHDTDPLAERQNDTAKVMPILQCSQILCLDCLKHCCSAHGLTLSNWRVSYRRRKDCNFFQSCANSSHARRLRCQICIITAESVQKLSHQNFNRSGIGCGLIEAEGCLTKGGRTERASCIVGKSIRLGWNPQRIFG